MTIVAIFLYYPLKFNSYYYNIYTMKIIVLKNKKRAKAFDKNYGFVYYKYLLKKTKGEH